MMPCWYSYKVLTVFLFQITIWAFCPYNDRCFMQLNYIHATNLVFQKSFTKLLHLQLSKNWHSGEEQIINNPEIVRFSVSSFFAIFIFVCLFCFRVKYMDKFYQTQTTFFSLVITNISFFFNFQISVGLPQKKDWVDAIAELSISLVYIKNIWSTKNKVQAFPFPINHCLLGDM